MLLKQLKYFFTVASLKTLGRNFLIGIGGLWLVLEVLNFFFEEQVRRFKGSSYFGLAFAGVALSYTLWQSRPRLRYSRRSREANVEVEIMVGDLFATTGNVAIGCSDCYDTEAPGSVDPKSLIAQLVKRSYGGLPDALDQLISRSLTANRLAGSADPRIERGKKERFPIGTVAVVNEGSRKVFLTVFSKARPDKTTDTTQEELWLSLSELWKVVRREGGLEPIAVPVWGSGMAKFHAARITLIQIVLLSYVIAARERPVSRKLSIIISENGYDPEEMAEAIQLIDTLDF